MELILTAIEARVIGSLIEKELTTPDYYPLTLNSLINACNQKTSRNPVMNIGETETMVAIKGLREKKIAWEFHAAGSRTPKYRHDINAAFKLSKSEIACICTLLLRGSSTVGEIRTNSYRMYDFNDLEEVDATITGLMEREGGPLVVRLPRQPGHKENRYAHLLCGDVAVPEHETTDVPEYHDRMDALERRIAQMEIEIDALKNRI